MIESKVTFEEPNGQKIIINFTMDESGLEYKPRFEPEVDAKTHLGLSGILAETLLKVLHQTNEERESLQDNQNIKDADEQPVAETKSKSKRTKKN